MTLVLDSYTGSRSHHGVVVTPATIAKVATVAILVLTGYFVSQSHAPRVVASHLARTIQAASATFGPLTISGAVPSTSKSNLKGPLVHSTTQSHASAVGAVHVANTWEGSAGSHLHGPLVLASAHS